MTVYEELVDSLIRKQLTVSAAESCTGGMFASGIIGVPDASKVLGASFITYAEEAKIKYAGVKRETLDKFGVVSENVAIEMAMGVCASSGSDVGVGITGLAGPSGGTPEIPLGTVCFGFSIKGKTISTTQCFGDIGRNVVREISAAYAAKTLNVLLKMEASK